MLRVARDYEYAVRSFHALDDTPMVHKRAHAQQGGWGIHWRLDDVLEAVFGKREDLWPTPPWYEHGQAMDHVVQVMTPNDLKEYAKVETDIELRMLSQWINQKHRSREELRFELAELVANEQVYDTKEVQQKFEILMFKAPFAIAIDKMTGRRGSLLFQDSPRFYFGFDPNRVI